LTISTIVEYIDSFKRRDQFGSRKITLRTSVGRLRMFGIVEGISFLALLGIAMPLKHFAEMPEAARIVGWVHGILFIGFVVALMLTRDAMRWSFRWTGLVLLAALLPFGPARS